jgi:hypothetical protein
MEGNVVLLGFECDFSSHFKEYPVYSSVSWACIMLCPFLLHLEKPSDSHNFSQEQTHNKLEIGFIG